MARKRASGAQNSSRGNGANLGSETQLWQMAEALRGSIDAAIARNLKELGYGG